MSQTLKKVLVDCIGKLVNGRKVLVDCIGKLVSGGRF